MAVQIALYGQKKLAIRHHYESFLDAKWSVLDIECEDATIHLCTDQPVNLPEGEIVRSESQV